jgi:peptidyl-prolyl cis-trans isomerase SurA
MIRFIDRNESTATAFSVKKALRGTDSTGSSLFSLRPCRVTAVTIYIYALVLISLLLPVTTVLAADAREVLIDRVLALVNGRPIFYSDIRRKIEPGPLVVVSEYPANRDAPAQTRALNDAINFELIMSAANDLDIEVSDADLEQEITRYLEEQKISKDKLAELLKNEGETPENYRRDFRNQMVLRRFQRRVIAPSIKITDKDVETYYLSQSGTAGNNMVEVTLRQLLIKIDSSMNKELAAAKKNLASDIYGKLKGGLDFGDAIGLYSDDPAAKSPDHKPLVIKLKDLSETMMAAVDPLHQGEFTSPISTPNGLIIFQLVEKKLGENRDFSAKKEKIAQELQMLELANQTTKWLAEQHQRVTIKRLDE